MLNWLDYLIIGFFIIGTVLGFFQGFRWQLYRICCLILAFFLAIYFQHFVNTLIAKVSESYDGNLLGGLALIFFGTLIISFFIGVVIVKVKGIDQRQSNLLGAMLGIFKNVLFCSIVVTGLWLFGGENQRKYINNSLILTTLRTQTVSIIYKLQHGFLKAPTKQLTD